MIRVLTYGKHSVKNLGFKTHTWLDGRVENYDNDVVIRWGNNYLLTDRYGRSRDFRNVINPAVAVQTNMSKIEAHGILSEVVRTPRMFRTQTLNRGLFVIRPCAHEGGAGFRVTEANGRSIHLGGYEYATEFLRTNTEYRVWFCGNRTMRAQRARTPEQQAQGPVGRYPCRSKWGYNISFREVPETLHNYTIKVAKAIGLECGAADVLLVDGKWYFLELNSAPSTDLPVICRWMKEGIQSIIQRKFGNRL